MSTQPESIGSNPGKKDKKKKKRSRSKKADRTSGCPESILLINSVIDAWLESAVPNENQEDLVFYGPETMPNSAEQDPDRNNNEDSEVV